MSDLPLAVLLAASFALVAYGVSMVSVSAGTVVGGLLLAVWSWLLFGDVE